MLPVPLAHLKVCVSGVIAAPIEDVWKYVRVFGGIEKWLPFINNTDVKSELLPGQVEGQVGCIRRVGLSNGQHAIVEQLVALDDVDHILKYKVISHPLNKNPFPGSFLNFNTTISLRRVTLGNGSFMEWTGEFDTEHTLVDTMKSDIKRRFEAGFQGLANLMLQHKAAGEQLVPTGTGNGGAMIGSMPLPSRKSGSGSGAPAAPGGTFGTSPPAGMSVQAAAAGLLGGMVPPGATPIGSYPPSGNLPPMMPNMDVHPAAPLAATAAQFANHAANMLYNDPFGTLQHSAPASDARKHNSGGSETSMESGHTTPHHLSPRRGM